MRWENPPNMHEGRGRPPFYGDDALDALTANPNRWAYLCTYECRPSASQAATRLKARGFQAMTRRLTDGQGLWAMWPQEIEPETWLLTGEGDNQFAAVSSG